ncbi:MAG: FAD-binding protein [Flavobacteriales bacterium]|nr:FAD-binding protein [Flavobacteriales bacterium]
MDEKLLEITLLPEQADGVEYLEKEICKKLKINSINEICYRIERKSLDARKKPIVFTYRVWIGSKQQITSNEKPFKPLLKKQSKTAIVVGFGSAGMFAALQLIAQGITPLVIERGKKVRERRRDLAAIFKERTINEESNYCFGEGGAGTFSDGKLYTRSKKRGDIQEILQTLVNHGAKPEILYEAHPHIGTNKLPQIVENIRKTIENNGGQVLFETKLIKLEIEKNQVKGIHTNKGFFASDHVILATGHSARDIFEMLYAQKIAIESKPFALGVRIEHPQNQIDGIQYKCETRGMYLPPSSYSLVTQAQGRGVFSFCMCPGGIIAPAMTAQQEVVVNGWSPSKRNGKFANSGFVTEIRPEDWAKFGSENPLAAMHFQQEIERHAYRFGGENLKAPAQRVADFVNGIVSKDIQENSYQLGVQSTDLREVLPTFVHQRLREAIIHFGKRMKGFNSNAGVLVGVESRTSSPVRIPRNRETLQHPDIKGFYPCGEGAGYAGGIMSAALDGVACARAVG